MRVLSHEHNAPRTSYRAVIAWSLFIGLCGTVGTANAGVIGIGDFVSPTIIDFEDAPDGLIGSFYAGLTFVGIQGGSFFDTGTGGGVSEVASNFAPCGLTGCPPPYLPGEIHWDTPITRAGFYITTNGPDDTTITALFMMGNVLVGSHVFDTGGEGGGGSFVGIEFLGGFDKIVIDPADVTNGAFAIDLLHYENTVPEPTTLALLVIGLAGVGFRRKRQ